MSSSSFVLGLVAVTAAPWWMALGFFVWDHHWTGSAFALNLFKCNLASLGFLIVVLLMNIMSSSSSSSSRTDDNSNNNVFTFTNVGCLMLSSTIGILIGDWTWLEGMRILGAKKIIVMDCFKPFLAALFGRVFLDEQLHTAAYMGLLLTIVGVTIVGLEKESSDTLAAHDGDGIQTELDTLLPPSRLFNTSTTSDERQES